MVIARRRVRSSSRRRCAQAGESAWVGVHQVYAVPGGDRGQVRDLDRSVAQIQATIAECQSLLVAWTSIAALDPRHADPADELYVLTPAELREFRW